MFPVLRAPKHLPSFGVSVDRSYYPYSLKCLEGVSLLKKSALSPL
jgi:hypothetical protein